MCVEVLLAPFVPLACELDAFGCWDAVAGTVAVAEGWVVVGGLDAG